MRCWAGVLAASLLAAQALALWPLDEVDSWKVTLQPYPILTGVALVLAALYLVLWRRSGEGVVIGFGRTVSRRGRLLTEALPAVGIAALAVGSTFDWPPGLVVLAASLSILALLGLASVGVVDGVAGRAPAYTMLAVGVVILPTAAQVTYIELGGLGGPGLSGLWPAFTIAGVAGLLAAVLVSRLGDGAMPVVTAGGLVVVVAGLCAVRLLLPASGGLMLILPFVAARGRRLGGADGRAASGGRGRRALRAVAVLPRGARRFPAGQRNPGRPSEGGGRLRRLWSTASWGPCICGPWSAVAWWSR